MISRQNNNVTKLRFLMISLFLNDYVTKISEASASNNNQLQDYVRKFAQLLRNYDEIILDEYGTILTWNNSFEALKGYSEEQIQGQCINLFFIQGEGNLPKMLLQQAAINGCSSHFGQFIKSDGSIYWGSIKIVAIKKGSSQILGYMVRCEKAKQI